MLIVSSNVLVYSSLKGNHYNDNHSQTVVSMNLPCSSEMVHYEEHMDEGIILFVSTFHYNYQYF